MTYNYSEKKVFLNIVCKFKINLTIQERHLFFCTFIDSLWISHHASSPHLLPCLLTFALCSCGLPRNKLKPNFKGKPKTKQNKEARQTNKEKQKKKKKNLVMEAVFWPMEALSLLLNTFIFICKCSLPGVFVGLAQGVRFLLCYRK